jgi:tRNA(Ile)-lysidine synthase
MRGCSRTGASATPRPAEAEGPSAARVAVAYSGGRDSTALLHATLKAAENLDLEVIALHVHHGLSPNADAWLAHCRARCARWTRAGRPVTFACARVTQAPAPGESVEAWARRVRYAALRELALAHGAELVLLGQHRRDQAETFLLQALRGAGPTGLAGMPRRATRDGITWARPWLDAPRSAIDAYLERHRLAHVDDESNDDARYARNRLRAKVWPALIDAFPDAEGALAVAATWAQEAAAGLAELAALDLERIASATELDVARWCTLSAARRSNALRAWLRRETGSAPAPLVRRLLEELPNPRPARWPLADGELRVHRGRLVKAPSSRPPSNAIGATTLAITRPGIYPMPGWGGALRATEVACGGAPVSSLLALELRPRTGGERFQVGPGRPPRSLKKQYQAGSLAAWQRGGPLVYSAGRLIFAPGLGIDARASARSGEPQMALEWLVGADADRTDPAPPRRPTGRAPVEPAGAAG